MPSIPIEAAQEALDVLRADSSQGVAAMQAAIEKALQKMGFRPEWAVPCLEGRACRIEVSTRDLAVEMAAKQGGVIEGRFGSPWLPER